MAGNLFWKERSVVTLTSTFGALANLTAAAVGTNVDVRTGGNCAGDYSFQMEMVVQWATVTGITPNLTAFDIFMVPAFDGTNFADVDTTSGNSNIPVTMRVGGFVVAKAPIAGTDIRMVSAPFLLLPLLYKPYLLNRSGQTTTANATIKIASAQDQYT